ncbi:hypothetical protein SBRCBS47491_010205 [Sporothrix bragantina]|uniref:AB hydrolase-1 domain-containing protein n=1 Tax=Sporothrix bragantina TaxID=671064 RepID=A0ABP0D276_9PEZI
MASTQTKPTFVFVPGAWHSAASFAPVTSKLEAAAYKTVPVELKSYGANPAIANFDPDVAAIRQALETVIDAGEEVVLFMHSYGGVVGTEACRGLDAASRKKDGKKGGIVRLVYCAAFLLPEGGSLMEMLGGVPLPWLMLSDNDTIVHPENPAEIFYNDLTLEAAAQTASTLKCHSYRTFFSKLTYAAYKDIPVTYVLCEKDNAIPAAVQQIMVDNAGVHIDVDKLDASHSPFLSQPDNVVAACRRAVGEVL